MPEVAGNVVTAPPAGPQVEAAAATAGPLAFTGSNGTASLVGLAALMLAAGAAIIFASRRRKGSVTE